MYYASPAIITGATAASYRYGPTLTNILEHYIKYEGLDRPAYYSEGLYHLKNAVKHMAIIFIL